jgi:hypothetical protein
MIVARMGEEFLVGEPEGKRPLVRSRHRWNVKTRIEITYISVFIIFVFYFALLKAVGGHLQVRMHNSCQHQPHYFLPLYLLHWVEVLSIHFIF